ncbi:M23 family metallopeptidase [Ideonella sp.]|uniref:M23 family metallopeptidase n=1 Tax=Ideonella sp. TaxID=1929293 RepID=UPI002B487F94|nr:M23 family metallopeptidase [Ideonella sp.]HJV70146.1 M23 family metallopeptidase [Ideonella sp.]
MTEPSRPSLPTTLISVARAARDAAHAHRHGLATGLAVVMTGFAVTAFGIAPLAPDAAELPRRQIVEAIEPQGLASQIEALAEQGLQLRRSENTRASDTADTLLHRLGVIDAEAAQFLRTDRNGQRVLSGRPGKMVSAELDDEGRLQSLVARYPADDDGAASNLPSRFTRLTISRSAHGGFTTTLETAPLEASARLAGGTIRSSLFAATDEAGIPDAIAVQMAEIFSADIDFHRELRKGDGFSIVYEALTADGEPITWSQGSGRVLAAEFVNDGRTYQAVWFGGQGGKGGYYDFKGESKRRAFLASPMEFSRVTSGFSMRFHPILQTWRAHLGTDYGAPTGTPVRAVGDGVVEFAGWQNGYGNVVQIQHAGGRSTLYGHLSRINVNRGQRVEQGQNVGAVGSTGWATGPHLHFEFKVNGQHQDPLKIAKAAETVVLDAAQRPRFAQVAAALKTQLLAADELQGVAGRAE